MPAAPIDRSIPLPFVFVGLGIVTAIGTVGGAFWRIGAMETTVKHQGQAQAEMEERITAALADHKEHLSGEVDSLERKLDELISRDEVLLLVQSEVAKQLQAHALLDGHPVMEERVHAIEQELQRMTRD